MKTSGALEYRYVTVRTAHGASKVFLFIAKERIIGRTSEKVTVQNTYDVFNATQGALDESEIRTAEVEGLVDSGAAYLCLPPSVIVELGLPYSHTRVVRTANGAVERRVFKGAEVTVQGRTEQMSVMENDESTPPLIGYMVLEIFDFVLHPKSNRIIPNPEHDGKWITDLY